MREFAEALLVNSEFSQPSNLQLLLLLLFLRSCPALLLRMLLAVSEALPACRAMIGDLQGSRRCVFVPSSHVNTAHSTPLHAVWHMALP